MKFFFQTSYLSNFFLVSALLRNITHIQDVYVTGHFYPRVIHTPYQVEFDPPFVCFKRFNLLNEKVAPQQTKPPRLD